MKQNEYIQYNVSFNKDVELFDTFIREDVVIAKNKNILYKILKNEYFLNKEDVVINCESKIELFNVLQRKTPVNNQKTGDLVSSLNQDKDL